jgi:hypothetical protein
MVRLLGAAHPAARLFDELQVAHGDGSFARRLAQLAKLDELVIDDFAISPMGAAERNDLLELLDDRVDTLDLDHQPAEMWCAAFQLECGANSYADSRSREPAVLSIWADLYAA